jgi:hypothetical protein
MTNKPTSELAGLDKKSSSHEKSGEIASNSTTNTRSGQDAQIAFAGEQQRMDDMIVKVVQRMVPDPILQLDKKPPAVQLADLTAQSSGRDEDWYIGIFQGRAIWRKLTPVPKANRDTTLEWAQFTIGDNKFLIKRGYIMWANIEINADDISDYEVSYAGVSNADERWLYVEVTLDSSATTQSVVLGENGYFPVDDPISSIVRFRLSKWKFTVAAGPIITLTRLATAWPGGALPFHAIAGPP